MKGRTETVRYLLSTEKVADVNHRSDDGYTPLHLALLGPTAGKTVAVVDVLLASPEVDVSIADNQGNSALHMVAGSGSLREEDRLPLAMMILERGHGVSVSSQNHHGLTPLHYAVYHGSYQLVLTLVRTGCDLDVQDDEGTTAYEIAFDRNRPKIMRYLRACGADIFVSGNDVLQTKAGTDTDTGSESGDDECLQGNMRLAPLDPLPGVTRHLRETHPQWTACQVCTFIPFTLFYGAFAFPFTVAYHYLLGTPLTKIVNGGVKLFDNDVAWFESRSSWRRSLNVPGLDQSSLKVLGAVLMVTLLVVLPITMVLLGKAGHHSVAVGIYFAALMLFQSVTLLKAMCDRRYFQVRHPARKVVLWLSQGDGSCLKRIKVENVPPLLSVFSDFVSLSAFAFLPVTHNPDTTQNTGDSEMAQRLPAWMQGTFDAALLFIGDNQYWLSLSLAAGLFALWFVVYSVTVTTRVILRSERCRSQWPAVQDTVLSNRYLDITVGLLGGTVFSTITKVFFQSVDCTEMDDGTLTLDAHPSLHCWEGSRHPIIAGCCMGALFLYILSTTMLSLYFREPPTQDSRDIKYIGFFLLLDSQLKTVMALTTTLLTSRPTYILRIMLGATALLLAANVSLQPCKDIRSINFLRNAVYMCVLVSVFVSYMFKFHPQDITVPDAFVMWAVTCGIVYFWYNGVPEAAVTVPVARDDTAADNASMLSLMMSNLKPAYSSLRSPMHSPAFSPHVPTQHSVPATPDDEYSTTVRIPPSPMDGSTMGMEIEMEGRPRQWRDGQTMALSEAAFADTSHIKKIQSVA